MARWHSPIPCRTETQHGNEDEIGDSGEVTSTFVKAPRSINRDKFQDTANRCRYKRVHWHIKYPNVETNLNKEETRLKSIRANMDPSRLAELESVNETLQYWQTQFQDAPASSEINGGGLKLLEKTRPAIKISGLEDIALVESTMSRALKRQIMNKLQVRLVAFNDHIEIKCRIPYESYKSIAVIMTIGL